MFRRMVIRMEILALAGLGMLLVAGPAKAQQGWPMNGSNWSYYGGSGGSSVRSYSPSYEATSPSSSSRYSGYSSYYDARYQTWIPRRGYYGSTSPVRVNLQVPGDARIWFDESPTNQTGTTRTFESPPVAVGPEYVYQIRVQWKRDGRDITQTRQVKVHAGDEIHLTLGSSANFALTP